MSETRIHFSDICWTLKRLFTLDNPPSGLLFKGGTSLSKVFKIIERFSEDIDLSFDRTTLGFSGEDDPLAAKSTKQRQRKVEALSEKCRTVIKEQFLPQAAEAIAAALGSSPATWELKLDGNDPDGQTLLFHYPQGIEVRRVDEPAYIRPFVRLEMGARSDHWPAAPNKVIPYVAEEFPSIFKNSVCDVHVLSAERTFWEKTTILHKWYHAPREKAFRDRSSRHYYDVVRIYEHGIGKKALEDPGLLAKVTEHMEVFFSANWAKYREAKPGTLHLVPHPSRVNEIRHDYGLMKEMIFGHQPSFDHLLEVLQEIETAFNRRA